MIGSLPRTVSCFRLVVLRNDPPWLSEPGAQVLSPVWNACMALVGAVGAVWGVGNSAPGFGRAARVVQE